MLVRERMKALGDHAKSSRQPPVKERKYAKAAESVAEQVAIDEAILESGAAHESVAAVIVVDAASQIVAHENGKGAVAEITPDQDSVEVATASTVAADAETQPIAADDGMTQAKVAQEDDDNSAAKRAIIHEWENWSALHSDELNDPNVAEYFFRHLEEKKPHLLGLSVQEKRQTIGKWISS